MIALRSHDQGWITEAVCKVSRQEMVLPAEADDMTHVKCFLDTKWFDLPPLSYVLVRVIRTNCVQCIEKGIRGHHWLLKLKSYTLIC